MKKQVTKVVISMRHAFALLASVCMLFASRAAAAECLRFAVTPTTIGCSGYSDSFAISQGGDIVGRYACGAGEDRSFVMWGSNGTFTALTLPNQYWSSAYSINANQEIAGTVEILDTGIRAFVYSKGQCTALGVLANHDTSEGFALNNSGIVVGYSANTQVGPVIACRWLNGRTDPLQLPIGPNSHANSINENNQIVGWMGNATGGSLFAEAFFWDRGTAIALPRPPAATSAEGYAVNSGSDVCGAFWFPNPAGGPSISHPIFWPGIDQYLDLGLLPGYVRGWAIDMNDSREIVGYCSTPPSGASRAFIWRNGVMTALDSLLAPASTQYQVWFAYGINNSGQIAATVRVPGIGERAAILTSVPPRLGDTNCDWAVNVDDLLGVINAWGPCPLRPTSCPADIAPPGGNGVVNVDDLLLVITNWG